MHVLCGWLLAKEESWCCWYRLKMKTKKKRNYKIIIIISRFGTHNEDHPLTALCSLYGSLGSLDWGTTFTRLQHACFYFKLEKETVYKVKQLFWGWFEEYSGNGSISFLNSNLIALFILIIASLDFSWGSRTLIIGQLKILEESQYCLFYFDFFLSNAN